MLKKDLEREYKLLKAKLEELSNSSESKNEFNMNKLVKVVSLYNGVLNLKTSNQPDATIFTFNFFGYEQPIFYSDLIKCINNQQRFFQEGFCMILDFDVVKAHYLDKYYINLLDQNQILNFLDFTNEEIEAKFSKLPTQQQHTVLESIAKQINENVYLDRNKITFLESICSIDLNDLASKLK